MDVIETKTKTGKRVRLAPGILYPLIITMVTCLVLSIFTITYVTRSNNGRIHAVEAAAAQAHAAADRVDKALHQMCPLFVTLDSAYHQAKPTTELGKLVAQEMHQVVLALSCSAPKPR